MKRILLAVLVTASLLVLGQPGVTLAQSGCEIAHECTYHYAKFLPPGHDLVSPGLYGWDPAGNYGWQPVLTLGGFCKQYGGYYYETADGGYAWNSCAGA